MKTNKMLRVYGGGIYNMRGFAETSYDYMFIVDNHERFTFPKALFVLNVSQNYYDIKKRV